MLTATTDPKAKADKKASGKEDAPIRLEPIVVHRVRLTINGTSPLIQHQWAEKAKKMIRDKRAGKKTKNREIRDPQAEGEAAAYRTDSGEYGVPAMAIKSAMVSAAHKDIGIDKTMIRKAVFLECGDRGGVLPMACSEPEIREDVVQVGRGSTDLRYRPYFFTWSVACVFLIDTGWVQVSDLCNLLDRAGFGVGVGEWRPEKGGEYGRFELDRSVPVESELA